MDEIDLTESKNHFNTGNDYAPLNDSQGYKVLTEKLGKFGGTAITSEGFD